MMPRLIRVAILSMVLSLPTPQLVGEEKVKETSFYPLQVGTTWHYRRGESKFTVRVVKHEKVGDVPCALLESKCDGKVGGREHLAVKDNGIYRYDVSSLFKSDKPRLKTKEGEVFHTQTLKPPMLVLKLPPKKGDDWKIVSQGEVEVFRGSFKVDEEQEIVVPAGKFKAFRVVARDVEGTALSPAPVITSFYAEGVGMVKQLIEIGDAKTEIVLEKFEAAGK